MISVCAAFMAAEDESKKKSERLKHAWDLRTPAKVRSVSQWSKSAILVVQEKEC